MEFEFDPEKSAANLKKHGLSLEDARLLWEVPAVVLRARVVDEERWMIIGRLKGRCHSCVFTVRAGVIRLISARRSRKEEERFCYERIEEKGEGGGV
ncbi:MAG: toxin [Candidatus Omnitrophica bacterium CG11_big_fil_rev_8_21_14_0_20_64_10]|nr:MAG: toxin [Candidatus Omnitrophica bacterium CG11_big_fil_rev_8_21_14_0_20_64_10]